MESTTGEHRGAASTGAGLLAILFWSTTVAFSRHLTEELGTLTAAAAIYLFAGVVSGTYRALRRRGFAQLARLPRLYLAGCGGLFVLYTVMLYLAIGLAANRQQAVEVGIVNYLWPSFTLLFSVPILRRRAGRWLAPGMAIAMAGVVLAMVRPDSFSWQVLRDNLRLHYAPYLCALVGAVAWGLYSNLSRRWAGGVQAGAVPLFILAAAGVLLLMRLLVSESSHWSPRAAAELAYMGLLPGLAAYVFWDLAMRHGRIILVASASYFIPLLSTLVSCLYLGVPMGLNLWLACALLVAGAALCRWSLRVEHPGRSANS